MNPAIGNVQANLSTIITTVQTAQPDAQFAVADYKDMGIPPALHGRHSSPTASAAAAIAAANSITASGAATSPRTRSTPSTRSAPARSASGPTRPVSSSGSGDAMGHDPSNGKTINDAIHRAQRCQCQVLAVNVDTPASRAPRSMPVARPPRSPRPTGAYLGTVGATRSRARSSGLTNLDATVTAVPTCDPGLSVSLSPASQTVPSGTSATFDEAITVAAGATQGATLHCSTNFLVNGLDAGPAFVQSVAITVNDVTAPTVSLRPRCQPRRRHPPGYQNAGFYRLDPPTTCRASWSPCRTPRPVRASDPMRRTRRSS